MNMNERYTMEPAPGGAAYYVADNLNRRIASGPYRTPDRAAFECDLLRRPNYHDGAPRRTWEQLGEPERGTWRRNPTPRDWFGAPAVSTDN